jgi:hypothetical protein
VDHLKGEGIVGPVGEPQGAGDLLVEHDCTSQEVARRISWKIEGEKSEII